MMDHAEARELLETAAAEPGGLDRLAAGDTAEASALAGHLAGCDSCGEEFGRLRRASDLLARTLSGTPPPDLRERTLAFVRELGVPRGGGALIPDARYVGAPVPLTRRPRIVVRGPLAWGAAIAAAIVLSVGATGLLLRGTLDRQDAAIESLSKVTAATLRVQGEPDVARVTLASSAGAAGLSGTILFSPRTRELVVVVTGLEEPPAGREYRCWVEVAGARQRVGKMFFDGGFAYWVGPVEALAQLSAGATFGVSLVDSGGGSLGGDPVLLGEL